jgi:hypothetical protein
MILRGSSQVRFAKAAAQRAADSYSLRRCWTS